MSLQSLMGAVGDRGGGGSVQEKGANLQYASEPVDLLPTIKSFLHNSRSRILQLPKNDQDSAEIECRLGLIAQPFGNLPRRLFSNYSKNISSPGYVVNRLPDEGGRIGQCPNFIAGVTRSHYNLTAGRGVLDYSPLSSSFGVTLGSEEDGLDLIVETSSDETVYFGYDQGRYIVSNSDRKAKPRLEMKQRLFGCDVAVPASCYDLRLGMSTEIDSAEASVPDAPPKDPSETRWKRRHSYARRDGRFGWLIDVTEVVSSSTGTTYEIEVELSRPFTKKLVEMEDEEELPKLISNLSAQLLWIVETLAPADSDLEVAEFLQRHPNQHAIAKAKKMCGALRLFGDSASYDTASVYSSLDSQSSESKSPACMPVNFQRHHFDSVQQGSHFVSEKTDGVRYLMVFTSDPGEVVLLDRKMQGWIVKDETKLSGLYDAVQPGTVLDGEIVINRKHKKPIFIIFDVMCVGTKALVKNKFDHRLEALKNGSFLNDQEKKEMWIDVELAGNKSKLPLVRKKFMTKGDVDKLMGKVVEEKGLRMYINGSCHHHLTDGIIFQPNSPYTFSTDFNLLKWKYLDTATVDVEVEVDKNGNIRFLCDAGDGARVDMSRYIQLPSQEKMRLEADRNVTKCKVAEVGFNPATGEWYYKLMRTDKTGSNHISTVMGTLLELAEGITGTELRVRMLGGGGGDTFGSNFQKLENELLRLGRGGGAGRGSRKRARLE